VTQEKLGTQDSELRTLLSFLIKKSRRRRARIAEVMEKHAGQHISQRMLDDWTSEYHKSARFPASLLQAFCEAVRGDELQRWAAGPRLRKLIEFAERQLEADKQGAKLLKPTPRRRPNKAKGKRPRKS
jgi:hypothetical protein